MPFHEALLPIGVTRQTRGGPRGERTDVRAVGGRWVQKFQRSQLEHFYQLDFGNKWVDDEAEAIRGFFYVVFGEHYSGFRVVDLSDCTLTQANSALVDDGGGSWRICRVYRAGAVQHRRRLKKIASTALGGVHGAAAPVIYRTRSAVVTVAADATVDINTANVTFGSHQSGDTYTCVGQFHVPVTFADPDALDSMGLDGSAARILQAIGGIDFAEVPES